MNLSTRKLAYTALMAVVLCICSWITVPFAVPFTMQTFAVFCSLLLLGGKLGTLSIGVYILLGMVGLPVFSGFRGGIGHIIGPTGGYIVGFLFSGLFYILCEPLLEKNGKLKIPVLAGGLLLLSGGHHVVQGGDRSRRHGIRFLEDPVDLCVPVSPSGRSEADSGGVRQQPGRENSETEREITIKNESALSGAFFFYSILKKSKIFVAQRTIRRGSCP